MDWSQLFLLAAVLAFLLEAFQVAFGTLTPKWWAIGVALYLASLVP